MKISLSWLKKYVELPKDTVFDTLYNSIMTKVVEIDAIHTFPSIAGLRTGLVVSCEKHPSADKLHVLNVDIGKERLQIVCGASNIAEGQRVVVATAGTTLPNGLTIAKAKIRDVESNGMIAAKSELGLEEDSDGIWVLPEDTAIGQDFGSVYLGEDTVLEIDHKSITHRPDLWGHYGFAREIALVSGGQLQPMTLSELSFAVSKLDVDVDDEDCVRYSAVKVSGVKVVDSPIWLQILLARIGAPSINNIVDASNYVMYTLGQPMHAFDASGIHGQVHVGSSRFPDSSFTSLDQVARTIDPRDLVIEDAEKVLALAGVIGGEGCKVMGNTSELFLESATFRPKRIRVRSIAHGVRTDASLRFEKSLDPEMTLAGLKLMYALVQESSPDVTITSGLFDYYPKKTELPVIELRSWYIEKKIGIRISEEQVLHILGSLGFTVKPGKDGVCTVTVPTFRATKDVACEDDLIEEIARITGYNDMEGEPVRNVLHLLSTRDAWQSVRHIKEFLSFRLNLHEVMLYSVVSDNMVDAKKALNLKNPISAEKTAVRTSLLPGLLANLGAWGAGHALGIYEEGKAYSLDKASEREEHMISGCLIVSPEQSEDALMKLKQDLLTMLATLGIVVETTQDLEQATLSAFVHPRASFLIQSDGVVLGYAGLLHPSQRKSLDADIRGDVLVFELSVTTILTLKSAPFSYQEPPRFPLSERDVTCIVSEDVPFSHISTMLSEVKQLDPLITAFASKELYRDEKKYGAGKKALTVSITWGSDERTLTEEEVEAGVSRIKQAFATSNIELLV